VTAWRVVLPAYFLNGFFKSVLMVLAVRGRERARERGREGCLRFSWLTHLMLLHFITGCF